MLAEIAEKGLSAGVGADVYLAECKKIFDKQNIVESVKSVSEKILAYENWRKEHKSLTDSYRELEDLKGMIDRTYGYDNRDLGIDQQAILKMVRDKASGKEVEEVKPKRERSSGFRRLFMGKSGRASEDKAIAEQQASCEAVNRFVAEFAASYKDKLDLLNKYDTGREIWDACSEKAKEVKNHENNEIRFGVSNEDREMLDTNQSLLEAYNQAVAKVEYQIDVAERAHETSGVKGIEANTGFDALAVKEQLRRENEGMSVQDIYRKVDEIRAQGNYSSPVSESAPYAEEDKKGDNSKNNEPKAILKEEVKTAEPANTGLAGKENVGADKSTPKEKAKFSYPENLSSKDPCIQKAIDLVKAGNYESLDALRADKESFAKMPRHVKQLAGMIYCAVNNPNSYSTQNNINNFCKAMVRKAEKITKEKILKKKGRGKEEKKPVVKREVSSNLINRANQSKRSA